jgi:hypothetical protein
VDHIHETTTSRVRTLLRGEAGPLEVAVAVVFAAVVWLLALGWDWSTRPQSSLDWVALGLVAVLSVGWLALRGRAVLGTIAICVPIVVLSGWRMAASDVVGWPTGLASLVFALSAICMAAALIGAWWRHRGE